MTFEELKAQIKTCGFDEVRVDNNDFFEGVIRKGNMEGLNSSLNAAFGPPAWPSQNKLSSEVDSLIHNHGGVMAGQTLYFTHLNEVAVFAMLWPWGDKEHITLKIGKKEK